MIKLKRFLSFVIVIVVVFTFGVNCERISDELISYLYNKREVVIQEDNGFRKEYSYNYIKETDDYIPYNKDELIEIFYTLLNNGWDEFTFYCPYDYVSCIDDVSSLSSDTKVLSDLNNYVSSLNNYDTIKTIYDNTGEITVTVDYKYSDEERFQLDNDINNLLASKVNDNMSIEDKIKVIHDYIINNSKYDTVFANTDESIYDSERIYGVLKDGYAICSGYADTMEVFLTKMNIPNFKVSSDTHVWNAVYVNDEWLHLDVTWDDPTTNTGEDVLMYDYFLVDNDTLMSDDDENKHEHEFDLEKFSEFKKEEKTQ